jgi:hypothetical protein
MLRLWGLTENNHMLLKYAALNAKNSAFLAHLEPKI